MATKKQRPVRIARPSQPRYEGITIYAGGATPQSAPSAKKKMSKMGVVGPLIGLAAVGIGGYLIYNWYTKNSCNGATDTTRCVNGAEQECKPFLVSALGIYMWQNDGYACSGTSAMVAGRATGGYVRDTRRY